MQKEINTLVEQLPNKSEFMRELADAFDMKYTSVKQHWIYGQSVPEHHQAQVLKMLKKKLENG